MALNKSATITDVAKAAKVSTATVSRALSDPDILSEKARKAVFAAIESTGYRVNRAARNLRMKRAGAVLILVPNLGKPFFSAILSGISDGFAGSDFAVLVSDTESQPPKDSELVGNFLDGHVDGILSLDGALTNQALDSFKTAGVAKRVVFVCEWPDDADFHSIRSDNIKGARLAIRHLHALGHQRIAHVTGPEGNVLTAARREGVMIERETLGLPSKSEWIIRGDFSLESGKLAAQKILAMNKRPTAVFCAADMVAFGLIATLHESGVMVPRDMSVIGFDDIEMAGAYVPTLTTIRQDRQKIGRLAARSLLSRIASDDMQNEIELVDVELVVRGSTAPPPK